MNIKIFLSVMACAALTVSCTDQMNYREDTGGKYDEEYVKSNFSYVRSLVTNIYTYMDYDHGQNYGGAMLSSASDESQYATTGTSIDYFYNGNWSPTSPQSSMWNNMWKGIADANDYMKKFASNLTFPDHVDDDEYKSQMYQYRHYFPSEVRFLRAYYYFNLVRQYGAVPLDTVGATTKDVNKLERKSASEVFKFIDKECAAIADSLPNQWSEAVNAGDASSDALRATRLSVLALRARAALYAASPLFNTDSNKELWKAAAIRCKAVIDACNEIGYSLDNSYVQIWGKDNAKLQRGKELIMVRPVGTDNKLESRNFPAGLSAGPGAGGNCPTQTFVEAFDLKDGSAVDWSNPAQAVAEFKNFDPRFALTVAVNGEKGWPYYNKTALETYQGGLNGEPVIGGTPTSYYLKKTLDPDKRVNLTGSKKTSTVHSSVVFRLGEFYLDYAEALYRWKGNAETAPTGTEFASGYAETALQALNHTRVRAGVAALTSADLVRRGGFWNLYERERMVELSFEGHRFWDVRRWKEGDKFSGKNIKVMKITKNTDGSFSYNVQTLEGTRDEWNDKFYLFPISQDEINIHDKYGVHWEQNPGWN